MASVAVNFVGGIPFQLLYDGVKVLLRSSRIFRTQLVNLEFTLDCLQPRIIQEIGDNSAQVNLPSNITQELQNKILDGTALVKKLSSLSIWDIRIWGNCYNCIQPDYAEQLDQLDRSLRALIEQLDMEQRRNVTLLLCSVRHLQDKNDEWEDKFSKFYRGQQELKAILLGNSDAIGRIEANSAQQVASSSREGQGLVASPAKTVGVVFSMLLDVVTQVQVKNKMIKRVLKELKSTLNCLQPLIQEMAEYNKILQLPKKEVDDLKILIASCVEYVQNCSNVGENANYIKYKYTNNILNSNKLLLRLYINLEGQVERKVKEAMDSACKIEAAIKKIEGDCVVQNDELRIHHPRLNLLTMQGPRDVNVIEETLEISTKITEDSEVPLVLSSLSIGLDAPNMEPNRMIETSVNLEKFMAMNSASSYEANPASEKISKVHLNLRQITKATCNFSKSQLIGEDSFGTVYKARLADGQVVSIKRARKELSENLRSEISSEIQYLANIEPLNLVKILGYVEEANEFLIITEYLPNGNLREHLDGKYGRTLKFIQRLQIAIDVAHALTYVHLYAEKQIIHRDVKSSNILLTESLRAKVADFGFGRLCLMDTERTHISTKVKGTVDYLDPEYMTTYQLTPKSDVYSFGIVLIEIVTGRRPVELKRPHEERVTLRWAFKKLNEGSVAELVDPAMEEVVDADVLMKIFDLAIQCAAPIGTDRPNMKIVGEQLWTIRADYLRSLKRR